MTAIGGMTIPAAKASGLTLGPSFTRRIATIATAISESATQPYGTRTAPSAMAVPTPKRKNENRGKRRIGAAPIGMVPHIGGAQCLSARSDVPYDFAAAPTHYLPRST
jgi:hypothetical protein